MDFHVVHNDVCGTCSSNYNIYIADKCCPKCMAQKSSILLSQDVQELVKKENKENRWKRRKRMAIWFLLFVPFTWIMGLKYGLSLEISFIAGYIYNTLHSHLVDFIMKYF